MTIRITAITLTVSKILRTFKKITFPPGVETAVGEVVEATVSDAVVPACALVPPCVSEEPFALEAFAFPSVPELSVLLCALEALFCVPLASAWEEPSAVAMAALSVSETGSALKSKGVTLEKRIGALPRSCPS